MTDGWDPNAAGVADALASGVQLFLGVPIATGPGALVPRAETELLGQAALEMLAGMTGPLLVIDMCCGSGNLACAIGVHMPDVRVVACDLTDSCVALTRSNVERLGLGERVSVVQSDMFAALTGVIAPHSVDLVVCNPPYISSGRLDSDRAALLHQEPREAFDGGPYGMSLHQRLIRDAPSFLRPDGHLLAEFGLGQERQIARLVERSGAYPASSYRYDPAGAARVVVARRGQL